MIQNQRENPNNFKYLEVHEILDKINIGIKYCDSLHLSGNKCTRIGTKYECEICTIPESEQKHICKAWKRVIHLAKLFYICQIICLINNRTEYKEQKQIPEWAEKQKKADIIMPNAQMRLFR
jgi:hypothetical protein